VAVAERMQEGQGMMKLDVLHYYPCTTSALQENHKEEISQCLQRCRCC
jgi:hypothetical protein